ncbi:HTH-type transcriptional regulator SutR [Paraconexibacter sp. AEG42_29]|uniref:HTH-type transcriptional regulator SutR n=1 Tax=Paraconexibacter sp. AEG42_29 TaxID=2997339 RepID=A0AAU7APQ5_9ACTN
MDDEPTQLSARIGVAVRYHRTARSLSVADLARATGLSKTILGRIESGAGNPSVQTLFSIARALDLPLSALLEAEVAPRVRAIPSGSGDALPTAAGTVHLLHADGRPRRTELFDITFGHGTEQASDGHLPGTEEVVVCLSGRLRAGPLGEEVALKPGDAVWFAADTPHRYVAERDSRVLDWISYPVPAS